MCVLRLVKIQKNAKRVGVYMQYAYEQANGRNTNIMHRHVYCKQRDFING